MNKLTVFALAALVTGTALAQSFWMVGPSQVSAINGNLDGSTKEVSSADGIVATLSKSTDSDYVTLGMDATFQPFMARTRSFVISLTATAKSDKPSFSHFEAFDFTSKEWLEVGGATSPRASRPVAGVPDAVISDSLPTSRFAQRTTGEIWIRAIWSADDLEVVYVDQLAIVYKS